MKELREDYHRQKKLKVFSPSLERVIHMEQLHDIIRAAADSGDIARLTQLKNEIQELLSYYEGGEWLADFDADNLGFFSKNLKRGILAEDTLYDLFGDVDQIVRLKP